MKLDKIIESLWCQTPYYSIILSIDGIGPNLASRIIADGDISNSKPEVQWCLCGE